MNLRPLSDPDPELYSADIYCRGNFHQVVKSESSNTIEPLEIVIKTDSDGKCEIFFHDWEVKVFSHFRILEGKQSTIELHSFETFDVG